MVRAAKYPSKDDGYCDNRLNLFMWILVFLIKALPPYLYFANEANSCQHPHQSGHEPDPHPIPIQRLSRQSCSLQLAPWHWYPNPILLLFRLGRIRTQHRRVHSNKRGFCNGIFQTLRRTKSAGYVVTLCLPRCHCVIWQICHSV